VALLIASILSLLAELFASAQPIRNTERIETVRTLLRSVETKDRAAQGVISSKGVIQHNLRIANERGGFAAFPILARNLTIRGLNFTAYSAASPRASYMTGAIVAVDGGRTAI
jgi:hypothetical protein